MLNKHISNLINIAIDKEFIMLEDKYYAANKVIALLGISEFKYIEYSDDYLSSINYIVEEAVKLKLISNDVTSRDIFEAKVMNSFILAPSSVISKIKSFSSESEGLNWLFEMNKFTNYIKTDRIKQNIEFMETIEGCELAITINNSKPEKTPEEIAKAAKTTSSAYPITVLSKDNVGFEGTSGKQPRTNHRVFPLELNKKKWYFQNSPYQYFNKHAILFTDEIVPMNINEDTFKAMLQFVETNNEFKVGANADIPIVGGSILYHNHYQAGVHHFPIENAKEKLIIKKDTTKISFTDWLVGSVVIEDEDISKIANIAGEITKYWKGYKSHSELLPNENNNTISSFAKKSGDTFKLYILFRNNSVSKDRPKGIYHVPYHIQAIKSENIGIIEAIGVAILPGRLANELDDIDSQTGDKWDSWKQWIGKYMDVSSLDKNKAMALSFHEILREVSVFNKTDEIKNEIEEFIKNM